MPSPLQPRFTTKSRTWEALEQLAQPRGVARQSRVVRLDQIGEIEGRRVGPVAPDTDQPQGSPETT